MFSLLSAIFAWGIVHSILASLGVKEFFHRTLDASLMRLYRLGYNIFSLLSFLPIVWLMMTLPDKELYRFSMPWNYLMMVGQGIAAVFLLVGLLHTDMLHFAGLRQLIECEKPSRLVTWGLYRYVRHPLYFFGLLCLWLSPTLSANSFAVYLGLTVYIIAGSLFEERKLLREFGEAYREYKSVTPMMIPGLMFHSRK
jgi:protein-S-isoprenylcysteine O-methyltransferase Ste14